MITLSNIYSREKTLFYFAMWNDSDCMGYENFLGYKVKNNLFIIPSAGEKGSVWYSKEELNEIDRLLDEKLADKTFEENIISTLDMNWSILKPYLINEKKITTGEELMFYYNTLVNWWSAMNTVFGVPDKDSASADFKAKILAARSESEKYTEKMNKIFIDFWHEKMPGAHELTAFVLPEEVQRIIDNGESLDAIKERTQGCFMHNREVYSLVSLAEYMTSKNLGFEEVKTEEVAEIKGRTAQPGSVRGVVKIIKIKSDAVKIEPGDIMVTEMTNPDYVPFMKIAGAIVTDEGGATCHAAIVSRELQVPCIVGTRVATKVLKDWDIVEVDTDKGIVKIIK